MTTSLDKSKNVCVCVFHEKRHRGTTSNSQPTSIMIMEKPFSLFVFGLETERKVSQAREYLSDDRANLTFPKPTDVNEEKVK